MAGLPDRALDFLEIAALVYGLDAAVSRGGLADQQMARRWHRRFDIDMTVRDLSFWSGKGITETLEETLIFLSGDRFEFTFSRKTEAEAERSRFFKFGNDNAWKATRVLMFSGGSIPLRGRWRRLRSMGTVSPLSAIPRRQRSRRCSGTFIGRWQRSSARIAPGISRSSCR